MEIGNMVQLENNNKYYLVDETVQNDIKYFLANKLDDKEKITTDAVIFKETIKDGESYLKEVQDEEIGKYILSVFTTTLINEIEDEKKED